MERDIEWTTLLLLFPHLNLDDVDTSYSLIIDICEHFNAVDRPDLWKTWLSLNLASRGPKYEFKQKLTESLTGCFRSNIMEEE